MNRRRIAALGAVAVFAAATIGVAVIAGGNDHRSRTSALAKLPIPEADSATSAGQASMAQPMGPLAYVVKGTMPALATTAPAYKISGAATGDDAARLANAIGLHGRVQSSGGVFVVVDGSGRLVVPAVASNGWMFDGNPGNTDCPASCAVASSGSAVAVAPCPPPPPCPADHMCAAPCGSPVPPPAKPADLPTKEQAEQIGKAFLSKVGIDLSHARIQTQDLFEAWAVEAAPVVDGLPVHGFSASATIGPKGAVTAASGHLGHLTKEGDYPLAGTDIGLARLRSGMFGFFGGPQPMTATAAGDGTADVGTSGGGTTGSGTTGSGTTGGGTTEGVASTGGATTADPGPPAPPADAQPSPAGSTPAAPPDDACMAKFNGPCPPTTTVPGDQPILPPDPPPTRTVTITGAHLALAFVPSFDEAKPAMLEPVYVFESDTGDELPPVPAAIDSLLEQPAIPSPQPGCAVRDGGPRRLPPDQAVADGCPGKFPPGVAPGVPPGAPTGGPEPAPAPDPAGSAKP